jgi:hypothetical protein
VGLSWDSSGLSWVLLGSPEALLGLSLGLGSPKLSWGYYLEVSKVSQSPVSFLGFSWVLQGSPGGVLGSLEDLLGSPGLSWGSLGLLGLS